MCDPISIGAAAIGGIGSAISGSQKAKNERQMVEARNRATEEEIARQHVYQGQAGGVFDNAMSMFSPGAVMGRLADAKSGAGGAIASNAPTEYGTINTGAAPNAAVDGEASKIADLFGKSTDRSTAAGNLFGYDQFGFDNRLNLSGTGRELGTISDFSRNSARVGGLEADVASNNAYKPPSGIGELLQIAGSLGGNFGGRGTTLPTRAAIPVPRSNPFIR